MRLFFTPQLHQHLHRPDHEPETGRDRDDDDAQGEHDDSGRSISGADFGSDFGG